MANKKRKTSPNAKSSTQASPKASRKQVRWVSVLGGLLALVLVAFGIQYLNQGEVNLEEGLEQIGKGQNIVVQVHDPG